MDHLLALTWRACSPGLHAMHGAVGGCHHLHHSLHLKGIFATMHLTQLAY